MVTKIEADFTESVLTKQKYEGVKAVIVNGVVTKVALCWSISTEGGSGWVDHPLPKGEEQLERLKIAIDDMLRQLKESKARFEWRHIAIQQEKPDEPK